jgi:hypothetical protein
MIVLYLFGFIGARDRNAVPQRNKLLGDLCELCSICFEFNDTSELARLGKASLVLVHRLF